MACSLKILGVVGQTKGGVLVGIKIYGSANGCDEVNINVICASRSRVATSKVTDNAWSVVLTPLDPREEPCQCNSSITVVVECVSGQCKDEFEGILNCVEVNSCPDVMIVPPDPIDPNSKCGAGGTRTVTGSVTVAPDASNPVGASVSVDGTVVASHPVTATPYTMTFSVSVGPGTHTIKVTTTDPGCGTVSVSFPVPKCPGTETCPKVELQSVKQGDCRGSLRTATVTVLVTPVSGVVDASLMHGAKTLDGSTGNVAPFTLSGTDTFSSGGDSVTVNVTNPPGCPPTTLAINVDKCQGEQPPPPPPDSGGGDDGDGSGGCLFGRIIVALLFGTALFLFLVGICVPGAGTYFLIAAAASAVAGGIAFALWWLFCGTKCGALLIMWQILMIGAWVSAFLATCCPLAIILAILLGTAATGLFAGWISSCKPSPCKVFSELLWVYVTVVGTVFAYLTKVVPCGLPAIPATTAGIAAVLAVLVKKYCK
jgi:hypothetical protein